MQTWCRVGAGGQVGEDSAHCSLVIGLTCIVAQGGKCEYLFIVEVFIVFYFVLLRVIDNINWFEVNTNKYAPFVSGRFRIAWKHSYSISLARASNLWMVVNMFGTIAASFPAGHTHMWTKKPLVIGAIFKCYTYVCMENFKLYKKSQAQTWDWCFVMIYDKNDSNLNIQGFPDSNVIPPYDRTWLNSLRSSGVRIGGGGGSGGSYRRWQPRWQMG